jgi:cell division protein FtsQ
MDAARISRLGIPELLAVGAAVSRTTGAADRRERRPWLRRSGRVLLLAALIGLLAAGVYAAPRALVAVRDHPYFAVRRLAVRGHRALDRETIIGAANVFTGMSIWRVSPSMVEDNVRALARVREATVWREFPDGVVITVSEREPAAIAVVDDGLHYVARSGRLLGPVRQTDGVDYPFLTGIDGSHLVEPGLTMVRRAMRLMRACERRRCGGGVSEIHFDSQRGLVLVPRRVPVPVLMGWGGWRKKVDRVERVLAAWEGQESWLASIDVSYRRSVLVKLHEHEQPGRGGSLRGGVPI